MTDLEIEPGPLTAERHPGGRPSKFTRRAIKLILRCARRGLPLGLCARAAGLSSQGLLNYRRAHPRFAAALERNIARGADVRLKKIEQASEAGDWRAAAWLLEHCLPQHFAKTRVEVSGPDGSPLLAGVQIFLPAKETTPALEIHKPIELTGGTENGNGD